MHAMYFIYISVSLYIYISFMSLDIGIPQITLFLYVYVSTNVPFHAFMHYAFYVQRQIMFEAFWIKKIYSGKMSIHFFKISTNNILSLTWCNLECTD